jgi:hypothetical protein
MFTLSNGFLRLGEGSLSGVLQEFAFRRLTKTKQQATNRSVPADMTAIASDLVPPAKKP